MFLNLPTTSRFALLRPTNTLRNTRPINTTSSLRSSGRGKQPKLNFAEPAELPKTTKQLSKHLYNAYTTPGSNRRAQGDNKRVNIVSRELCDDIIERMKPSLLKHAGCDVIDINPGAGVWSSAVHNLLKPRTHYLMEPDYELYTPLLKPLLEAEGSKYKLIPKSGAVWGHLNNVLSPATLPQQEEYKPGDPRLNEPNNTLLVLANLGWHPRKPFRAFPSISLLVMHQLLASIRAHSLFHRYGLIRMLVWVADDEGQNILPRSINSRRKIAIEAEVSCSNIFEIASSTTHNPRWKRDEYFDIESSRKVLKRMEKASITTPEGRAGQYQLEAAKNPQDQNSTDDLYVQRDYYTELEELEKRFAAGKFSIYVTGRNTKPTSSEVSPEWKRLKYLVTYFERRKKKEGKPPKEGKMTVELAKLEAKHAAGKIQKYLTPELNKEVIVDSEGKTTKPEETKEYKRMLYLRGRAVTDRNRVARYAPLIAEFEAIIGMQMRLMKLGETAAKELRQEIEERTAAYHDEVDDLTDNDLQQFRVQLDNRRTFKNDPEVLCWDRRQAEPLKVKPEEFFPKQELCLLDFHPAPLWPSLRKGFPASYDIFEFILSTLLMMPTQSIKMGFTSLAPGAYEWLLAECPSITDPSKGGSLNPGLMTVRCLTLEMLKEIIDAWMRWPFQPERYELMRRMGSAAYDPDDEPLESQNP